MAVAGYMGTYIAVLIGGNSFKWKFVERDEELIFLLRPNNVLPLLVRIPVSSKTRFLRYSNRLLSTLTPISGVVTKISLEKATSKAGKPYALYHFEAVRWLRGEFEVSDNWR